METYTVEAVVLRKDDFGDNVTLHPMGITRDVATVRAVKHI